MKYQAVGRVVRYAQFLAHGIVLPCANAFGQPRDYSDRHHSPPLRSQLSQGTFTRSRLGSPAFVSGVVSTNRPFVRPTASASAGTLRCRAYTPLPLRGCL